MVAAEAERWYAQSFRRFEALGLQPRRIVTALPGAARGPKGAHARIFSAAHMLLFLGT